jgi:DNA-binding transcriptional LysR family regulator
VTQLRQIEYFLAVAREGQMTRAAHRLHLAQPALSHSIAQLESQLGVALFERHARGVSLTPAGRAFLVKARTTVADWTEAIATARSFAAAGPGVIVVGFVGVAPGLDGPTPLEGFCRAHREVELRFRELPFPTAPTGAWLAEVDVAVCHQPSPDAGVWCQPLRRESRVVLAAQRHPLASRNELTVADVLDEAFIGYHPSVDPLWAGFWSLDDHRGARPRHVSAGAANSPQEMLALLWVREAITTAPLSVARALCGAPAGVVAIPLRDAHCATIALVGHERRNPHIELLRAFAGDNAESQ